MNTLELFRLGVIVALAGIGLLEGNAKTVVVTLGVAASLTAIAWGVH